MFGGYVWSLVAIAVLATGAVMAFVTLRYSRTHARRSEAEKRLSEGGNQGKLPPSGQAGLNAQPASCAITPAQLL